MDANAEAVVTAIALYLYLCTGELKMISEFEEPFTFSQEIGSSVQVNATNNEVIITN